VIQREREKKSWSERDRMRTQSFQTDETRPDVVARQNAASKQYKAALEALFEKKPDAVENIEKLVPAISLPRVVETAPDAADRTSDRSFCGDSPWRRAPSPSATRSKRFSRPGSNSGRPGDVSTDPRAP